MHRSKLENHDKQKKTMTRKWSITWKNNM